MNKNISYINYGNIFSKSFFIKENLKEKSSLLITETNKDIENYEKIMSFLNMDFRVLNTYESLNDLVFNKSWFFITSLEILENIELPKNQLKHFSISLEKGWDYNLNELTKKLLELKFSFSEYENSWTFRKNWDIFKIISSDSKTKYEISFWWDTIEEIRVNSKIVENINIWKNEPLTQSLPWGREVATNLNNFLEIISPENFIILDNLNFSKYYDILNEKIKNISSFDYIPNKNLKIIDLEITIPKIENTNELKETLTQSLPWGREVATEIYTKNTKVIENFIEYNSIKNTKTREINLNILKSFKTKEKLVICDNVLAKVFTRKRVKKNLSADLDLLLKIKPWDYVVHIEHWIWIFKDIIKREIPSKKYNIIKEYIEIEYAWEDKLFVPITEVSRVNKYLWVENPKLTGLWWVAWERKLQKAKEEAEEIAQELIEIYAQRKLQKWFSFLENTKKEDEFKNSFTYTHTEDQSITIDEILEDMSKPVPMDRLVVWDVGFGKTEIAFNAIYRSFLNKKQSILIVPLVVLAYEHFEKAKERFKSFGLNIWILTRLETEKKASETIRKLASGELDLVIWTHKLLSDKIIYKDLWLIVTDEEHKFGVSDKEKIKEFKATIDSLAMSATPIPRSLNMALSNIRQISILKTPPFGRQDIDTIINRFSDNIIASAWEQEFNRWWQMFFVHNRVANIENIAKILQNIFPDKRIIITHGQLPWIELEKRIIAFKNKKYDILLSTTVIENWIDFSNVNTIIINNAEHFWLSQIHQLRWRVGRSDKKWYCHLLYKQENIKPETAKRLKTIVEYSYVWAGFELAMKDLEIRWGWDLLGFRQSGQSSSVWINLYLKIIEEKILELQKSPHPTSPLKGEEQWQNNSPLLQRRGARGEESETKIDLDIEIYIPDDLFGSELDKINFYREIELITDLEELENIKQDFIQNIPPLTPPLKGEDKKILNWLNNLFDLLELKIRANKYLITNIKKNWINYQINFFPHPNPLPWREKELEVIQNFLKLDKQVKFVVKDLSTLRTPVKSFANNEKFLKYMLSLFKGQNLNTKIKKIWRK